MKSLEPQSNLETNKPCSYAETQRAGMEGITFCTALKFRVMIPKQRAKEICSVGGDCSYRIAGIKKEQAIERANNHKRRLRR